MKKLPSMSILPKDLSAISDITAPFPKAVKSAKKTAKELVPIYLKLPPEIWKMMHEQKLKERRTLSDIATDAIRLYCQNDN